MSETLLPRTDAGVVLQAAVTSLLFLVAVISTRRNKDLLLFVVGLAVFIAGVMAARTIH